MQENTNARGVLFSFQLSVVSLMEYEMTRRVRTLSTGPFTLEVIMQINCPILAHICCVDNFKWPLTKDIVVLRVTTRTFVIALPGLLYGLQFPNHCNLERLKTLSTVFRRYAHFLDLTYKNLGGYPMEYNEPGMLSRLRPHFEATAHETLFELGNIPGISRFCMESHNSSFLRACRMSVTCKMIMESMRTKTMTSSLVNFRGTNPPEGHRGRAYAVASTYTRLVDAAEYSWLVSSGLGEQLHNVVSPLRNGSVNVGFQVWNLNELGLLSFMSRFEPGVEQEHKKVAAREERWNNMAKEEEVVADADADADADAGPRGAKRKGKDIKL